MPFFFYFAAHSFHCRITSRLILQTPRWIYLSWWQGGNFLWNKSFVWNSKDRFSFLTQTLKQQTRCAQTVRVNNKLLYLYELHFSDPFCNHGLLCQVRYVCSADGCHLAKPEESIINDDQVLVLKRIQQTIRAVDQRTGVERYSIYSYKLISCLIFLTDTCDVCVEV